LSETTLLQLVKKQIVISENKASFSRSLRRYIHEGVIQTIPGETIKKVLRAGLPRPDTASIRAYRLAPVGDAYVKRKGWNGVSPLHPVTDEHLAHDLICAETLFKMQQLWLEFPEDKRGLVDVYGPRQVLVWDTEKNKTLIAPDGLLIKRKMSGDFERAFLVEYQNVRALLQVKNKLAKYEELAKPEYRWVWDFWGLDEMPWVLVIYRQGATLQHYREQIEARGETLAKYACASLEDVWAGKLSIKHIKMTS
jgi:hypothetical protein